MRSLRERAFGALALLVVAMAVLIFGAAGTWRY
jgi:hypothetical protein